MERCRHSASSLILKHLCLSLFFLQVIAQIFLPGVYAADYSGVYLFQATGDLDFNSLAKITQNGSAVEVKLIWDDPIWKGSVSGGTMTFSNGEDAMTYVFSDESNFTGSWQSSGMSGALTGYKVSESLWPVQGQYGFVSMWPSPKQPWYFTPNGVAVSQNDEVYVLGDWHHNVTKLTSEGHVVTKWGLKGAEDGMFQRPRAVTVGLDGNVFVLDSGNSRVQKFSPDGTFLTKWGSAGNGDGQFNLSVGQYVTGGIAAGPDGSIYVADVENQRIQKFSPDGTFLTKWGEEGSEDGQFLFNSINKGSIGSAWGGITVDEDGYVYVADTLQRRIQKFTAQGVFVSKWHYTENEIQSFSGLAINQAGNLFANDFHAGDIKIIGPDGVIASSFGSRGNGDGETLDMRGIAIDKKGEVYIASWGNHRIEKFSSTGHFINKWGPGNGDGEFVHAKSIAIDSNGNLVVLDFRAPRVQKFALDGTFVEQWPIEEGDGSFVAPVKMALDSSDNIYIVDATNNRILKYDPDGLRMLVWGTQGSGDGEFNFTNGGWWDGAIAIDQNDTVYIADTYNHRVQKFDTDGNFLSAWGTLGPNDGQLNSPEAIGLDGSGNVYLADRTHGLQKFTASGSFVSRWDGYFFLPEGIAVDGSGAIYVADSVGSQIFKLPASGETVTRIGFGTGIGPGQFLDPADLVVGADDKLYIADRSRVQVFQDNLVSGNSKAIVLAGGGAYPGNNLWDATRMNANFAYRALTYKGFTKESIYYLTSDLDLDLDGNGVLDDVDGDATNVNLQQAITTWAADADELTLYLVDHGGDGTFRMSGTENLSAVDLDSWLDQLQATIPGKVTVIYDACESGSFLPALTPPDGKERILVTSTSPDESAYFVSQGSISFSNFFWTNVFNGTTVKDAFDLSTETVAQTTDLQNPLLDDDADGVGNGANDGLLAQATYIGNDAQVTGAAPVIGSTSGDQVINDQNSAELVADDVTDDDGIARVWAVIKPPDYVQGSAGNPVQELPGIDLMPTEVANQYKATYTNFSIPGTYYIAIYARDRLGNTAVPLQTTVSVNNPLRHKAVVIAGAADAQVSAVAVEHNIKLAYQGLRFQGYSDDDIYLLSQTAIAGLDVDGPATLAELQDVMNSWAADQTQDLLVYLMGAGGFQRFQINTAEALTAQTLDQQLDAIQATIPGRVTVVYDASESGSFLPVLIPPVDKDRVVLTSAAAGQPAYFLVDGAVSFSTYFWIRILNGTPLYAAFSHARQSTAPFVSQVPQFDANGNGRGNEKTDRVVARYYTLGSGIMLAGDDPLIGSVSPDQTLPGTTSADIWAEDITTTGTIDNVWAVVTPPTHAAAPQVAPQVVDLEDGDGDGRYTGSVDTIELYGTHTVAIYAMDANGNVSLPAVTNLYQTAGPDVFEEDDTPEQARVIIVNGSEPQTHTFHDQGDADWVQFYAVKDEWYDIKTENLGSNCDTTISLYGADGTTPILDRWDTSFEYGQDESYSWQSPADGIYYVKIEQYYPEDYGTGTEYDLKIYIPAANMPGQVIGKVLDQAGNGISGALAQVDTGDWIVASLTLPNGIFFMPLPEGTFTVTAEVAGQVPVGHANVIIAPLGTVLLDWTFDMVYPGDVNGDGWVDLVDVVVILQALSGEDAPSGIRDGYPASGADVNGNNRLGMEEAIHTLQMVSGMRSNP